MYIGNVYVNEKIIQDTLKECERAFIDEKTLPDTDFLRSGSMFSMVDGKSKEYIRSAIENAIIEAYKADSNGDLAVKQKEEELKKAQDKHNKAKDNLQKLKDYRYRIETDIAKYGLVADLISETVNPKQGFSESANPCRNDEPAAPAA